MPPPPSPPSPHHNVIIIVFVLVGGLFFLAFFAAAIFCCLRKRKKKMVHKSEDVNVEDHIRVHETIVQGPHGEQVITVSVDEDIKAGEIIKKDELIASGTKISGLLQQQQREAGTARRTQKSSNTIP
ncbi:hypothetical protein HPP92_002045 [Vanilla planifolia]|nr:hypothetical protein HPP92_002045 [Vanilla planifolia]